MVIDTSVLVAIALNEAGCDELLAGMQTSVKKSVSAVSLLESGIVLRAREGLPIIPELYGLVERLGLEVVSFDDAQARLAIAAFSRYGKGMGHRAQLNFGDCAVYALALSRGEPVLATGRDFAATDITVVPLKRKK